VSAIFLTIHLEKNAVLSTTIGEPATPDKGSPDHKLQG